MFLKDTLSDNAFNDILLGKYYSCNQVLATLYIRTTKNKFQSI